MPVLPLVASMSVSPGLMRPRFSAPRIMESAGRSFTEPAGLLPSSLASTMLAVLPGMRCRRTSGVLPTKCSSVECKPIPSGSKQEPRARRGSFRRDRASLLLLVLLRTLRGVRLVAVLLLGGLARARRRAGQHQVALDLVVRRIADAIHLLQVLGGLEGAVLLAVVDDGLRLRRADAVELRELLLARRVDVDDRERQARVGEQGREQQRLFFHGVSWGSVETRAAGAA